MTVPPRAATDVRSVRASVGAIALAVLLACAAISTAPASGRAADTDPSVTAVSAGNGFACSLLENGSLACWGDNWAGGLGNGTTYRSVIPQVVSLPGPATALAIGESHACALLGDGTARCWGRNWERQVGSGSTSGRVLLPSLVLSLDHLVAIGAGDLHTCALRDDGTAWCWGSGGNGQNGPAWTYGTTVPVQVTGITNAVNLWVGGYHTCLGLDDGTVTCFGYYPRPDGSDRSAVPTPVPGVAGALAMASGEGFSCAVMPDGTVRCFGFNTFGTLGDGTQIDRPEPVTVPGITTAVAIGASGSHVCVALDDGSVTCWGLNTVGQLGPAAGAATFVLEPVSVTGISGVTAVDGGFGFTCAVAASAAWCWGDNNDGALGDRTVISRSTPAPISWVPDTTIPIASAPSLSILDGRVLDGTRVKVRVHVPVDDGVDGTGLDHLEAQLSKNGGSTWITLGWRQSTFYRYLPSGKITLRLRAVDRVGNVGPWITSRPLRVRLVQQSSSAIRYKGAWATGHKSAYSGGSTRYTTARSASAKFSFTGRSVAIVSRRATTRGSFRVYVDGVYRDTVDLHATSERYRIVVFSASWPTKGEHTIRMVALGTTRHPRVDLDAFVVLR